MSGKFCAHCGATLSLDAAGLACVDCATWLGFGDTTCAAEIAALRTRLAEAEGAVDQLTADLNRASREMERERYKHLRTVARILASVPGYSVLITDHTEINLPDDVEIQSWEDTVQRGTVVRLVMRGERCRCDGRACTCTARALLAAPAQGVKE